MPGMQRSTILSHTAFLAFAVIFATSSLNSAFADDAAEISFNRDIRSILSNHCFACHGPDKDERQGGAEGLRLDAPDGPDGAFADLGGYAAIVAGKPEQSEVVTRITSDDPDTRMPPAEFGNPLSETDIERITEWIRQGAKYARHWSYEPPARPVPPGVQQADWPRNDIDRFVLARLESAGLAPSPEADRYALARRAALDLTGLPPTIAEVDAFVADESADAYERMVDRLLAKEAYGEHMARMWLDLARYADSAGYADDPPRTIWAYRDYVIRAFNANTPFDQFTIEQIAGDLLPDAAEDQLIATAFHRNTMTNNEGGTSDEEFRNVAIVDRVNTTMAVWMGTTMACAQCHSHKYDPLTQEEYFRLFAILNNTADVDQRDESPLLEIWTTEQERQKAEWQTRIAQLEEVVSTPTPDLAAAEADWAADLAVEPQWATLHPASAAAESEAGLSVGEEGIVTAAESTEQNSYSLRIPVSIDRSLTALQLETLPEATSPGGGAGFADGKFVITHISASVSPPPDAVPSGRYVRIELPGDERILSLAEVQVFEGDANIAIDGTATQSSTAFQGPAALAIDGNTDGDYKAAKSTTHTKQSSNPWWELDLGAVHPVDRIAVWNRTDGNLQSRFKDARVLLLNDERNTVWEQTLIDPPQSDAELAVGGPRSIRFATAFADVAPKGHEPGLVLDTEESAATGWGPGDQVAQPHVLTLIPEAPLTLPAGSELAVKIEQRFAKANHTLGRFRLSATDDTRASEFAALPADVAAILRRPAKQRSNEQRTRLSEYYRTIAPSLATQRDELAALNQQLAEFKPYTTVPVMRELPESARRTTHVQIRGNYQQTAQEVTAGVPAAFHPLPEGAPADRLALAQWLVARENPLTARVMVNRLWEKLFGAGLVKSSEEFGTQGDLPTHPELLDWLAVEFMDSGWDVKGMLRLLATSATYRQSSRVTPELLECDPANSLLTRGPRVRLTAETIRDQALAAAGLLSPKLAGPPVRPPQPEIGLRAAFGSGIDWQTSEGEDRYRRGIYTSWRRSNPYPSMATFDAPNREVCTLRRPRTNTPLQALVTLNDPVFVEAAQGLGRRMSSHSGAVAEQAAHGFRICLARPPSEIEVGRLVELYESARVELAAAPDRAATLAFSTGPTDETEADPVDLAAWTVVGNVLLNLDEVFMKR